MKIETEATLRKTAIITLRSENDGDLSCIAGMRDADGEPVIVQFGAPGSLTADCDSFADDENGSVEARIIAALESDDNVISYTIRASAVRS